MNARAAQAEVTEFRCELPPSPYPGLRPFEPDEWPVFFGRETMADEVIARIVRDRLLVVHGDSGCGKSSLIYAGVLPHLEQEAARSRVRWSTCASAPGEFPLDNLATALAGLIGGARDMNQVMAMRRLLNFGRDGAAELCTKLEVSPSNRVCILIDQFEELFAHAKQHGPQEASLLIEFLIGIQHHENAGLCAVLTMRSEFLGACAKFPGFAEAVNTAQYLLPRMEHSDLLRAIREPATLYNGEIDLALAENLIADVGGMQDQLPLIQHGLMVLYRAHMQRSACKTGDTWRLSQADCEGNGRALDQLLSDHASEVADRVGESRVVEDVFRALTDINSDGHAVRRPRTLGQLVAVTGAPEATVRSVVDAFRVDGVSFLRPYGTGALTLDSRIDISHEALIRCWQRISAPQDGWLVREFKNGLVWRSLLVQADSFERNSSNVLSGATTEERETWLEKRNAAWAERYGGGWERVCKLLAASISERERQLQEQEAERKREEDARLQRLQFDARARSLRHMRIWSVITAALALLGIALAGYAFQQSRRAQEETLRANFERQVALFESERNLQARVRAEERSRELEQVTSNLRADLEILQQAMQTRLTEAQLRAQLQKTQADITQQVNRLSSVATPPRIYIHISDESQRFAARELTLRLEKTRLGKELVVVPGIELKKPPERQGAQLRCFEAQECVEARELENIVNKQLSRPKVRTIEVRDHRSGSKLRARHYELWFGPGSIELEGARSPIRPVPQTAVGDTSMKADGPPQKK